MSSTSPETFAISTFASPRPAPPPMVVPLFATTVHRRYGKYLAIHEDLPPKPCYHPYPQTKRSIPTNVPSTASTSVPSSEPGSPLTPTPEELPNDTSYMQTEPRLILIPPPQGTLSVASLKLPHQSLTKEYRTIAKTAILELKMDVHRTLSEQDPKSRDEARTRIETAIPQFKQHEDHWGADILLRDQLKSMRDVINKANKKEQKKKV